MDNYNCNYKDIPSFPGYQISEFGQVRSNKSGAWLNKRNHVGDDGYARVSLYKNGKARTSRINRLVLLAHKGKCPKGQECRHIDGDKLNNHINNLAWGAKSENIVDRLRSGKPYHKQRLSESKVKEVWRLRREGKTLKQIAGVMEVEFNIIKQVLYQQSWKWVQCDDKDIVIQQRSK